MTEKTKCPCGRPLHYDDPEILAYYNGENIRPYMEALIAKLGDRVKVIIDGRAWQVPRHYIALDGFKGYMVPSLGFEEVTAASSASEDET